MKRLTPAIFIILFAFFSGCSDDDSLGNRLDHIRYYDFALPGSGFSAEKKFHYDTQGKISKTVTTDLFDYVNVWEYTYAENLLIVENSPDDTPYNVTYRLKFENEQLTRFTVAQRIGHLFETDSVEFLYESGKLNAFKFGEVSYPVSVDNSGNIIHLQSEIEIRMAPFEYDNRPNPIQHMPMNFIILSFQEGIENQLHYRNIIQFFSKNNLKADNLTYSYEDGKVVQVKETNYGTWAKFYYRD